MTRDSGKECSVRRPTPAGELQRYFIEVVLPYAGDECLVWPYGLNSRGYAQIRVDGKNKSVHRLTCVEVNGPPPPKHDAAHNCGNRACVNPRHIRWATRAQNMADKFVHGTFQRGEGHGATKLTEAAAREISGLAGKESQYSLARRFGISRAAVSDIHCGRSWAWINGKGNRP